MKGSLGINIFLFFFPILLDDPFYMAVHDLMCDKNTLSCPSKNNSNAIELTVHTSCYWGLRLTLCYIEADNQRR